MRILVIVSVLLLAACAPAAVEEPVRTAAAAPPAAPPSVPPPPVPPPPPEQSPAFLALPATPLQPTGDPKLDDYLRRILHEAGPAWAPLLLRAFHGVRANPAVLEEIAAQPKEPADFVRRYVTPERIEAGRRLYPQLKGRPLFEGPQTAPTEYLLALWGVMSDYGERPPRFDMIEAIANAAAHGYGPAGTEFQIYHAVAILAEGRVPRPLARAYGGGRIGQVRWLPDQYLQWREDGDGDGFADIWTNRADILRNFQRVLVSWEGTAPGVVEVLRPEFDLSDPMQARMAQALESEGNVPAHILRRADGRPWPAGVGRWSGSVAAPFGGDGPHYFVSRNGVILNYASPFRSRYGEPPHYGFAVAVSMLAEAIAEGQ